MKIKITEEMMLEAAIKQIEQRLRVIEVALPICRHSKRKHQIKKMQRKLVHVHMHLTKRLLQLPGY